MTGINFTPNNQPAFGMAFRFDNGGARRMAEAFINSPDKARNLIKSQIKNKDVTTLVTSESIDVLPKVDDKYAGRVRDFITDERIKDSMLNSELGSFFIHYDSMNPNAAEQRKFVQAADLSGRVQTYIDSLKNGDLTVGKFADELELFEQRAKLNVSEVDYFEQSPKLNNVWESLDANSFSEPPISPKEWLEIGEKFKK